MGIDSLTERDDGSRVKGPDCAEDWRSWVSAGRTRNWMLEDPLIDWLQLYGKNHDYISRREADVYDTRLDSLPLSSIRDRNSRLVSSSCLGIGIG